MFQSVSAFSSYFLAQTDSDKNHHNHPFFRCSSTSPFIPKAFHEHILGTLVHTCTEAIFAFCDSSENNENSSLLLASHCLPPPPSPPERDRDFYVIFHRMHHRKEQHQTRDVDENLVLINGISYSPVFEKRLLYSYYNMF